MAIPGLSALGGLGGGMTISPDFGAKGGNQQGTFTVAGMTANAGGIYLPQSVAFPGATAASYSQPTQSLTPSTTADITPTQTATTQNWSTWIAIGAIALIGLVIWKKM